MKKDTKKKHIILFIAAFCVLYIILAMVPLSQELHITPDWTEDISHVQTEKNGSVTSKDDEQEETLIPFRLGQNMGYFTPDGRIVSCITFPFKAALSDSWYSTYGESDSVQTFYNSDGTKAGEIKEYGFPFFDKDRIYMFYPGGSSFGQYDKDGNKLWDYENYAPVTCFSSSEAGCVAGFADGRVISFTKDGTVDQNFVPGGSEVPVIIGAGISNEGKYIACISGQKQQRFVVAEKNGEHSRIIFHEYLPADFTRQVLVRFSNDSKMVFYNYKGGLGILDMEKLKSSHIDIPGYIVQIEQSSVDDLFFVLSRNGDEYTVTAIEPFDHPAAKFSFKARCAFIQVRDNALFVGRNNKISRMSISRR